MEKNSTVQRQSLVQPTTKRNLLETKNVLFIFCSFVVLATGYSIYLNVDNSHPEKVELSQSQIDAMVRSGVIQVNTNIDHEPNSDDTGLVYQTSNGPCSLYQDVFGRYYCRW